MKVRIKDWDDAVKAALADSKDWFVGDDNIFGIGCSCGDWGMVVEGDEQDGCFHTSIFAYPMCVVDKLEDYKPNPDDVLRYGKIIEDEMLYENCEFGSARTIRIRLISYNGSVWYHKMADDTVMECRKVGGTDDTE